MAAFSVAVTSMLAGLLNPMWLSLIWKKLNEPAFGGLLATEPSARRRDTGTPPMKLHNSPVPAHSIQFRKSRRSIPSRETRLISSLLFLLLSCAPMAGIPLFKFELRTQPQYEGRDVKAPS